MARHANVNTTMIYAHNIDRIAKAPERKIAAMLAIGGNDDYICSKADLKGLA
jgi:hypothetical protein